MLQSETVKKYDTYKDSGIEWIGEIPQEWNRTKLKRLLSTPITDGPHETPELLDDGIPFLSAEAVKNNKLNFDLKRGYISPEEHLRFCKKCKPQLNDIFMIKSGATTGNVAIVDTMEEFSIWSPLALIRADENILYFKYLFYYLQSYVFKNQVELFWSYGTQQNIGMEVLGNLYIAFSKTAIEQQQIAEYLDKKCGEIDRVVETEKSVIEKLKEYKQSIITEAVTKGLDKSTPLKDSGIEWIGKIPQHWETCKLLKLYKERKCKNKGNIETNVLSLSYGNIKKRNVENNMGLLPESFETYNIIVPDNIVLRLTDLQNDHRSLRCGLVKEQGIITSAYVTLEKKLDNISSNYYYRLLHTFDIMKGFYGMGDGVRQNLKYDGELCNLLVVRPPYAEQQQIAEYLDNKCSEIDKAIADKEQVIEKFTEYKKSLIYECVTGKRKVAD